MAAESHIGRSQLLRRSHSLADAPELQEYVLHDITEGEEIGAGAFGAVLSLMYHGAVCAGKRLHAILVTGESNLLEKFVAECRILKNLRHPHIVQFLGICFLPSSDLPVLVMEFLRYNLHDLLETHSKILMSVKLSILHDIVRGLLYLHSQHPPIVHRDLSARNVLLNSALIAKIADFGVARIINTQQLSRELTRFPGAGVYMPPEAGQSENITPVYTSKLDIFSLGIVFLFTVTQEFPQNLLPATFYDESGVFRPRNEQERRQQYVDAAEQVKKGQFVALPYLHPLLPLQVLGDHDHPLLILIRECLDNIPLRRPNTRDILQRVGEMSREGGDDLMAMDKLHMIEELQRVQLAYEEQQVSSAGA